MADTKVSLSSQSDLKNASDDAIANYLNSLSFTQTHTLGDVRLALGYGSFIVSAACFAWDYKFGFESTKIYSAVAVVVYVLLQGVLWWWVKFMEDGCIYQGLAPSGEQILISTSGKKTSPMYNLRITLLTPKSSTATSSFELARPFTEWFNEAGYFVPAPFQEFLASNIPVVGKADPKRVRGESQKMFDANPELLDAVLAGQERVERQEGTTTGSEAKSGGKRRKA